MDDSTTTASCRARLRDGTLAAFALGCLAGALAGTGRLDAFLDPRAAAVGTGGSVALEWLFLRYPERTLALWERRPVQVGGVAFTVGGGVALLRTAGAWSVAAIAWGLIAYLALLGIVLAGGRNPVARLVDGREREA